ncbi:MAG: hypothetical protein ACRC3Y_12010 [Romboutsia sp.]|uniref:hypothetical protein n=1 Tax=Romboutsia sp. TaxID=1965302 RepID=UPI003F334F39
MKENLKNENYCGKSGSQFTKLENNNFTMKRVTSNICNHCEIENSSQNNYCKSCGNSLSEIKKNIRDNETKEDKYQIKSALREFKLGKIAVTSLSSIVILFIMAFIFKMVANSFLGDLGILLNPFNIIMGLNSGYVDINSTSLLGSGNMNTHLGMLLLLIGPIIAIGISNIIFMKNKIKSAKDVLLNSFGIGIIYGIMLFILSILSSIRMNFNDMIQYQMAIEASYRPLSMLINGFIIAFLVTYLIGFKRKYHDENIYLTILKKAINTIGIGYIVVLLILTAITLSDRSYLYEFGMYGYVDEISIGVILSQLSAYMWGFANFIPITISNGTISMFNLLSSDLFLNTKLIFIIMIALSSLIILVNGCNLKRKYKDSNVNVVLVFSLFYALLMGVLALFSSIIIGGNISLLDINNYQGSVILGFPVISAVIRSFIYSFILTLVGYKLYVFE